MRYFFHVMLGAGRTSDPEGTDFESFASALDEAELTAREVAAEEIRSGRPLSSVSQIEIADDSGMVHAVVPIAWVVLSTPAARRRPTNHRLQSSVEQPAFFEQYHRSKALFTESREIISSVKATFAEMKARLQAIN